MATSKLFNPVVSNLPDDTFVGAMTSPEVSPTQWADTSGGEACNPLSMSSAPQGKEMKLRAKRIVSKSQEGFDY